MSFLWHENLLHWQHFLILAVSVALSTIVGKLFFETGLGVGRYHATHSKTRATVCRMLFIGTFVLSCFLLELVTFEILDIFHPVLRQFSWTATLGMLCFLLNFLIPGVLAFSIGNHLDFPLPLSIIFGLLFVVVYQIGMYSIGQMLPISEYQITQIGLLDALLFCNSERATYRSVWSSHPSISYIILELIVADIQRAVAHIAVIVSVLFITISYNYYLYLLVISIIYNYYL